MDSTRAAVPLTLIAIRRAASLAVALLVLALDAVAFAESYRGLLSWAQEHGLSGTWALLWPLQVDTFVLVGELMLLIAVINRWGVSGRLLAWAVTIGGLVVSVGGNVGHVDGPIADHATAAVPPIAAWVGLVLALQLAKRTAIAHAAYSVTPMDSPADSGADSPARPVDRSLWAGGRRTRKARARLAATLAGGLSLPVRVRMSHAAASVHADDPHLSMDSADSPHRGDGATAERGDGATAGRQNGAPDRAPVDNPQGTATDGRGAAVDTPTRDGQAAGELRVDRQTGDAGQAPGAHAGEAAAHAAAGGSGNPSGPSATDHADRPDRRLDLSAWERGQQHADGPRERVDERQEDERGQAGRPSMDSPADGRTPVHAAREGGGQATVDSLRPYDLGELCDFAGVSGEAPDELVGQRLAAVVDDAGKVARLVETGNNLAESGRMISRAALRGAGIAGGNRELGDVAAILRAAHSGNAAGHGVTLTAM